MRDYNRLTSDIVSMMIDKLKKREHHGDWNTGDYRADLSKLNNHLHKEYIELHAAIDCEDDQDVIDECIDVINICAMIIDVIRHDKV